MKVIVFKLLGLFIGVKISRIFVIGPVQSVTVFLIIGHLLDLYAGKKVDEFRIKLLEKKARSTFIKRHVIGNFFQILGRLCCIDGEINEKEINRAKQIAKDVFNLNEIQTKKAVQAMKRRNIFSLKNNALKFFQVYQHSPSTLDTCYKLAIEVARSDGRISEKEDEFLKQLSAFWQINKQRSYQQSQEQSYTNRTEHLSSDNSKSYEILGCTQNDSDQIIKKKYRILVSKYHPDKIISKDVPKELMMLANEKFQSIQQAYEEVMSTRKI